MRGDLAPELLTFSHYTVLLKTRSLDNKIQEFLVA